MGFKRRLKVRMFSHSRMSAGNDESGKVAMRLFLGNYKLAVHIPHAVWR